MPRKDKESRNAYQRELMRKRRANTGANKMPDMGANTRANIPYSSITCRELDADGNPIPEY